jgi:predicted alpha/beta-fold hydrolase
VRYRRERLFAPDGDIWDFDWVDAEAPPDDAPLVVLFHGLEGGSGSHYALTLMALVHALGWSEDPVPAWREAAALLRRRPLRERPRRPARPRRVTALGRVFKVTIAARAKS